VRIQLVVQLGEQLVGQLFLLAGTFVEELELVAGKLVQPGLELFETRSEG